ncbi:MAG TPA: MaoC/PaaZ C-terminal domain-containing protein [Steroidobacteraceae bacterium]|nr:MaoC/PaaZ C-terminal domain-containing protein [Steroidobacteraceae bacterium]
MTVPPSLAVPARRISAQDIESYASLTGDYNPLHLDAEFAARTRFGQPIVYGTLLLAPIWETLAREFGGAALEGARAAVEFKRPIKVGSLLHMEGVLVESDSESTTYRFVVNDGHGGVAVDVNVILAVGGP